MVEANMSDKAFRSVNQNLGAKPRLGPIPAELFLPWSTISLGVLLICQFLALNWVWTTVAILGGITTWWVLTGKTPWRFMAKFQSVPRWAKGYAYSTHLTLEASPKKKGGSRR